jgi:two-component system, chemotaxis family, chemotaxis protein CheY
VKRCLIIDDSEIVRKVARVIITSLKYQVEEASNAEEALLACRPHVPEVILVDWHIPGTVSLDLIKSIRSIDTPHRPHIIYVITERDADMLARATSAGIDDILLKPFDRDSITWKLSVSHTVAA